MTPARGKAAGYPLALAHVGTDAGFAAAVGDVTTLDEALERVRSERAEALGRLCYMAAPKRERPDAVATALDLSAGAPLPIMGEDADRAAEVDLREREAAILRALPEARQRVETQRQRAGARLAAQCPERIAACRRIAAALRELADANDEYAAVIAAFVAGGYGLTALPDARYGQSDELRAAAARVAP